MSEVELRNRLADRLQLTVESLVELALIVREFEERGLDLSEFRLPLLVYLRRIAYGQTLPEIVSLLVARPALLQRVAYLSIADQQRCISDGVPTVTVSNGSPETHNKPLLALEAREARQVFGPKGIRSENDQLGWIYMQDYPALSREMDSPHYVIEQQMLVVHQPTRLTKQELQHILREMDSAA